MRQTLAGENMGGEHTQEEYIARITDLEMNRDRYVSLISDYENRYNDALEKKDVNGFLRVTDSFSSDDNRGILVINGTLLRMKIMSEAVRIEQEKKMKSFIRDVDSVSEFQEKYAQMNLLLRRLEFDIPDEEAAYRFILEREVSSYSISAILYNITSALGHRQKILMKISSYMLDCGSVQPAYQYLCMIQRPGTEAVELRDQPWQLMQGSEA